MTIRALRGKKQHHETRAVAAKNMALQQGAVPKVLVAMRTDTTGGKDLATKMTAKRPIGGTHGSGGLHTIEE
eukprot:5383150-Prorocentrum_lima.AAC.1